MSTAGQNTQQLQQDIGNECHRANLLLYFISKELSDIINFTEPGGELESTIKQNASLMATLSNLQKIDLGKVSQMVRKHIDINKLAIENDRVNSTLKNDSEMNDSENIMIIK